MILVNEKEGMRSRLNDNVERSGTEELSLLSKRFTPISVPPGGVVGVSALRFSRKFDLKTMWQMSAFCGRSYARVSSRFLSNS